MSVPFLSTPLSIHPSQGNGTGCLCLRGKERSGHLSVCVCVQGLSQIWLWGGFPRCCIPSSSILGPHLRKLGPLDSLFVSQLMICLLLKALSVCPTVVRKTSDQCWKGNQEEELWKNICQRVQPAASLQSSSVLCFGASHTGRLLQSCWDAVTVLTHLLPSPFLLSKILKRRQAATRAVSEAVPDVSLSTTLHLQSAEAARWLLSFALL